MDWLIAIQKWLYGGMAEGIRSATDTVTFVSLLVSAFVFGMVHALTPGHGKTVLVSYHLGRENRPTDGLMTGSLLALTHVGTAVLLAAAGVAAVSRSLAAAGRPGGFEAVSAALIVVIGVCLLWRALRPHDHSAAGDGRMLAMATGLIPCPLTTFILTYALAHKQLPLGLAAIAAMLAGLITTLAVFTTGAIVARDRFFTLLARTETLRRRWAFCLEVAAAIAVLLLGLTMLIHGVPGWSLL